MLGGLCPEYWLFYSGSSKAYLEEYETLHHFEKVLAKAIKNNPEKFPAGYIFELNKSEKQEVIKKFDNLQIKFSPASPKAFTEKGLYMLATILKSKRETDTTIERRRF
jgi:hypothetical protein